MIVTREERGNCMHLILNRYESDLLKFSSFTRMVREENLTGIIIV
jgi:hypothetical protein